MMELATLLILGALGLVAWLRMSKMKTPIAGWKFVIVLALAGILVFFFFGSSVEDTSKRTNAFSGDLPTFGEVVAHAPWIQLALIGAGFFLFFIGSNVIFYLHNRRLGKEWWYMFNPLQYAEFNRREWVQFAVLVATSFALLVLGVNLGHGR
jgi:hypothetical protein